MQATSLLPAPRTRATSCASRLRYGFRRRGLRRQNRSPADGLGLVAGGLGAVEKLLGQAGFISFPRMQILLSKPVPAVHRDMAGEGKVGIGSRLRGEFLPLALPGRLVPRHELPVRPEFAADGDL